MWQVLVGVDARAGPRGGLPASALSRTGWKPKEESTGQAPAGGRVALRRSPLWNRLLSFPLPRRPLCPVAPHSGVGLQQVPTLRDHFCNPAPFCWGLAWARSCGCRGGGKDDGWTFLGMISTVPHEEVPAGVAVSSSGLWQGRGVCLLYTEASTVGGGPGPYLGSLGHGVWHCGAWPASDRTSWF